jgi:acyl carrier protein
VILRELGLKSFVLASETTASEVPGWDSLSHAAIIAAVEDEFRVRFSAVEIVHLANVGQLQALVEKKAG